MDRQPNILYLMSDEHAFRYMGHISEAEGGEPAYTPTFDRLASEGTVFTDAYCQMPLCTPSRFCQLTGREVRNCGAWSNSDVLRPELDTLPKAFARAGYETCLVGKMHLGGNQQFIGFQHRPYGDLTGRTGHQWEPLDAGGSQSMRLRTTRVGVTEIPESLIQDEVVAQETVAWIREHHHAHPETPWFLCASFSHPHFPLTAPRRHFERYWPDNVTPPKVPAGGDAYDHPMSVGMREGFRADDIGSKEEMRARAAYFGCVTYLDEVIGDMLLRLEADGLLENTVIVYTSDHGEMAGEHGVWWKNGWYEACTRVPLIVSLPEQRQGTRAAYRSRTPVGQIDLFPTLCALAGIEMLEDVDGVDVSAAVRGDSEPADRPIICDALTPRWGPGTEFRMLRYKQYKYVIFRNAPPLFFDLEADPGEQHNLIERGAEGEAADVMDWLAEVAASSIDFDEAERERTVRDGDLREHYALRLPKASGNLYLMPNGRLVNVDDPMLYHPTLLADEASDVFGDWPEQDKDS